VCCVPVQSRLGVTARELNRALRVRNDYMDWARESVPLMANRGRV
jgi:hypothetical protein